MSAILAASAAKAVYSGLKHGAGTDPTAVSERAWNYLTPFQRLDWMRMSGEEINIIYCDAEWPRLPIEHRVRLCRSLTCMVELFARLGAAKEANGQVPKAPVPGNGCNLQPKPADVHSGALDGEKPVPS